MARCVSIESITFFFVKSQTLSRMRTRGSRTDATRSRVSSSDAPTLTTTSSHTSSSERIAGTMGKSSLMAFRTMVKPESMADNYKRASGDLDSSRGDSMTVRPMRDVTTGPWLVLATGGRADYGHAGST
jgi:hypothetical protein